MIGKPGCDILDHFRKVAKESGEVVVRDELRHRIIRKSRVKVRADAVRGDRIQEQGITVGLRLGDAPGRNGPAGAALIVDDDRLPERIRKFRANCAGDEIRRAAWWDRHDELD